MLSVHRGSCHCGRVNFELAADLVVAMDCNCSLCRRKGALWHGADEVDLRILSGEEELALYQFNTMTAKHYFCRHCGVQPFGRPRIAPSKWVVNVRCIDAVDLSSLKILPFDGLHWEEAAAQFLQQRRAAPATA